MVRAGPVHDERVRYLIQHHLLDELTLALFPAVASTGARLFDGVDRTPLRLVDLQQTGTGVVLLTYQP